MIGKKNIDRIMVVGIAGAIVWIILVARLFTVQILMASEYNTAAISQQRKKFSIRAPRGIIYGRDGRMLAKNSIALAFWTERNSITNIARVDSAFAAIVGTEPGYIFNRLKTTKSNWLYLARQIDLKTGAKLKFLENDSVFSEEGLDRTYPFGRIAGQLLGFVDVDGYGREGIELQFDKELRGHDGEAVCLSDASGRAFKAFRFEERPAVPGANVHLTIDPDLQQIVEAELAAGVDSCGAESGIAIFMKPSTGEILALACYPSYDPNYPGGHDPLERKIRAITDIYEPGSTFKIVAFSALLQNHAFAQEETIDCENGRWGFGRDTIHDASPHGRITAREVLVHSSNIGTIKLSLRLPPDTLYSYARSFGFGSPTGIDLPGEASGMLHRPEKWSRSTPAAFPMGHEVAVTAVQMAAAYAAIANRGLLLQPYIVSKITDSSGRIIREKKPFIVRRVFSEAAAETLCEMLAAVTDSGTGTKAKIKGLSVAGKTGTADKVRPEGGYDKDKAISSFAGFAPVERPEIVGVVVVDNPTKGPRWGGWIAAPIWRNIVSKAFATGVLVVRTPERFPTGKEPKSNYVGIPDVLRMTSSQAVEVIEHRGLAVETFGSGTVVSQSPMPGRMVPPGTVVRLLLKSHEPVKGGKIELPNVVGMTLRDAAVELATVNVKFKVIGSGIVVGQNPQSGYLMNKEQVCLLNCEIPKNR